jgi:nicotinate-nucleotide adenylyltransferase
MRIGIYGGTFDPPHIGHLNVVETAKSSLELDLVIIVPAYISPVKIDKRTTPPDMRLKMCDIAFNQQFTRVSLYDLEKHEVSYTIDTLRHFKTFYPDDELFLLVGTDSFLIFEKWKNYKQILQLATIAVVARDDNNILDIIKKQLWLAQYGDVEVLNTKTNNISSSEIRNNLEMYTEYLPKDLYEFVKMHNLFP